MDILLYAILALFIGFRLYHTLGRRDGFEPKASDKPAEQASKKAPNGAASIGSNQADADSRADDTVVPLHPDKPTMTDNTPPQTGAQQQKDNIALFMETVPDFDEKDFLNGARIAFERIVEAYAAGDMDTLKPLLGKDLFEEFQRAVQAREQNEQTLKDSVEGFESVSLYDAWKKGRQGFVAVRFVSEQISVLYDKDGTVMEGDPDTIITIDEIWTFARAIGSHNPNWHLVGTEDAVDDDHDNDDDSNTGAS